MVKDMGNRVFVVREVLVMGNLEVLMNVFALDEEQRNAVDKTYNIGPTAVKVSATQTGIKESYPQSAT
jgi:hypothetical protein